MNRIYSNGPLKDFVVNPFNRLIMNTSRLYLAAPYFKAAAVWRAGGAGPKPPKHLSRKARAMWREIVASRPADHFAPGSTHLLESFVVASVATRELAPKIDADPGNKDLAEALRRYSAIQATQATKLRLAVSSAIKPHSGKLTERAGAHGPLIGGTA